VVGTRHGRRVVYTLYDVHVAELIDQAVGHIEHPTLGAHETASRRAAS
jgi:ArsR family transcriptional regulator, nickel/cobalt-responsive transcriptional repressor